MSKGPSSKALVTLALIGALGVGAIAYYVKSDPLAARVPANLHRDEPQADVESVPTEKPAPISHEAAPVVQKVATVSLPEVHGDDVTLSSDRTEVPDGANPKVFLAEHILKTSNVGNVKVLGVDVRNGVAVVNFGEGIDNGMGSSQEGSFLKALQRGFGQFADVTRVQITKNGEPIDSLGGHIELTDPLPVIRSPLSPESGPSKPSESSGTPSAG